jgi:dCMP deaminase
MGKEKLQDKIFINIACEIAKLSNCVSYQVGCVLVLDGRIISQGYNGTPPGFTNCSNVFNKNNFDRETHAQWSTNYEVHSEMNTLLFSAKHGISTYNTTAYTSVQPCHNCLKHMIVAGVKRIVYKYPYDRANYTDETYNMLKIARVKLEQI